MNKLTSSIFIIIFSLLITHLGWSAEYHRTKLIRTVPITIIIKDKKNSQDKVAQDMQLAFNTAAYYFDLWSLQNKQGDIYRLNKAKPNKSIYLKPETINLLTKAFQLNQSTQGYFNIFYKSPDEIKKAPWQSVLELNTQQKTALIKKTGVLIDTNGIAKGAILDSLKQQLITFGYNKFLINSGGDIITQGTWSICLKEPLPESTKCSKKIHVTNQAVMTSGNYERGPHLFNPLNSHFTPTYRSSTVVALEASTAGPWAVATFLNPDKWAKKKRIQGMRFYEIK